MDQAADETKPLPDTASDDAAEELGPVNVALLVDEDYVNRFGSLFGHMVIGLVDEVVNVTVVCPDPELLSRLPTGPTRIVPFRPSAWPWRYRAQLDTLVEQLDKYKVNVIHACSGTQGNLAYDLAQRMELPYLVTVTGLLQRECYWRLDRQRCAALIAISEPIRRMLAEAYGSVADRIRLVRPGCFCRVRPPRPSEGHSRTIVSAGFFDRQSGYDLLLRALAKMAENNVEYVAFLFGTGPQEYTLHRWARRAGLSSRVTFLPPIARWQGILDDTDVYVQPGRFHRLHSGPYEALARGCPVVATPETGFDLVVEGETGRLFPLGDEQALTDILTEWLTKPDSLVDISQRTSQFAKEHLSLRQEVMKLIELYRSALAR